MELSERSGALLTTSLFARDWFSDSPYSIGVSGGFAYHESTEIMNECDLLIGFGAGLNASTLAHGNVYKNATIVQVDTNPAALDDHRMMNKIVLGDAKETAQALLLSLKKIERPNWRGKEMAKRIKAIDRFKNRDTREEPGKANPRLIVDACDKLLPKDRIISTDIGQFLGVPASYMTVQSPGDIVFPWQLGRVGCGLPVALGAAVGRPDRLVVTFLGDGGMMAAMHALDTVKSAKVPILIIVLDNAGFESERWIFRNNGDDMWTANYDTPDLSVIAKAFGLEGYKVHSSGEMIDLLKSKDFRKSAALIQVVVDTRPYPTEMELSKGRPLP
jgi:thiamine pyrophosphate-dependent acetolactate synthase large subunit-like protein